MRRAATKIAFTADQMIYAESDPAEYCYRVMSGIVRVYRVTASGQRQIDAFPGADDPFGWTADRWHSWSAKAITDVVLLRWPRHVIETAIRTDAKIGPRLLLILFQQLAAAQDRRRLFHDMPATARIAAFLLSWIDRHGHRGTASPPVLLQLTRRDLADHLELTVSIVGQTLNRFRRTGLIDFIDGESVQLLDRQELERIAAIVRRTPPVPDRAERDRPITGRGHRE